MQKISEGLSEAPCNSCQEKATIHHQIISDRAYQIFLEEGSRPGRTTANWYEAEVEFALAQEKKEFRAAMPCGCGHISPAYSSDLDHFTKSSKL